MSIQEQFLSLVRLGIGHQAAWNNAPVDWNVIRALAVSQGLSAVVLDGLDKLHVDDTEYTEMLPLQLKLEWIGEVLQNYEQRYSAYEKAISSLASFYNQHGFKMMVLKGYVCSLDWPNSKHRPCGDIDIWLFGQWKEADNTLAREKGIKIDSSHHHHTVFYWNDFMVENHYDFVNVHHSKSNSQLERVFKELGADDAYHLEVKGQRVYVPSPNLHALFLLRHAMIEFAASGINLRQLLDWAFYAKEYRQEIDWTWLDDTLKLYGMKKLFDVFNAIVVCDLGFDVNIFPQILSAPAIKAKVLNEILSPAIPNDKPHDVVPRMAWKWRRWKANEWKRQLVYKESMRSAFWSGMWNHLLKPSSI